MFPKGHKHTEIAKRKISEANKGRISPMKGKKHSKATKRKIGLANSIALKGRKLSKKAIKNCKLANLGNTYRLGCKTSERTKKKMSKTHKRIGSGKWMKGRKKNPNAYKFPCGEKHPMWKGGKMKNYPELERLRKSKEYKLWRKAVFERDNYTCIFCGDDRGGNLQADHIKPFALFPELRFAIDNGRTLCKKCHKKTDTYGSNFNKNYKTIINI